MTVPPIGEFGHARLAGDHYYTLDADKIVPALVKHLELDGRGPEAPERDRIERHHTKACKAAQQP
jgi:hypothetical protein